MLTLTQYSAKLGISRQRLHKLIIQKRIAPPPAKLGNYWVFKGGEKIIPVKTGRPAGAGKKTGNERR